MNNIHWYDLKSLQKQSKSHEIELPERIATDPDTFSEHKDDIPIVISDDESNDVLLPLNNYANNDGELLNFKLADIGMRFGVEKRNMVESQMLNLCVSLERQFLQKQL